MLTVLRKIFELYVLEKEDLDTKDLHSIELYRGSCAKVEISLKAMELVDAPFMEINLQMKTFHYLTKGQVKRLL